ncbi:MAG: Asp-tRNA(Asn)/Glu-tRNA(Gln) amidotransferase subunit GatB [Anaerolineae bacterium]
MDYEAVIGLEVHAQVHTRSKMYCNCPVVEDTGNLEPNIYVCPVCLALPGTLPVVNRRAVEYGMMTALALHCTVAPVSVFSRKSYFYPDLPKGYQISQYDLPLSSGGYLEIEVDGDLRRIGVTRVHLEEDTGKLYHMSSGALVDFNRAGVPLLEIVSEPDMRSVEEVYAYATALRDILIYLGVNSGDMEKGVMRFEANVSVRLQGSDKLGTRAEIKNLNSFRALTRAVEYEIGRQIELVESGGTVEQHTLGWDEDAGETYVQRSKEFAHDYRYFPEPDLPPLEVSETWIDEIRERLPELPLAKKRRLVETYDIRPYDANLLVQDRAVAGYFERAAQLAEEQGIEGQEVANWITGEIFRLMNETNAAIEEVRVTPEQLLALLVLRDKGKISVTAAKTVFEEVFKSGDEPGAVVERLGLAQISDTEALAAIVDEVLDENPEQVEQYLSGKEAVIGWFIGQVMRASRGKANPQEARKLLQTHLERRRS